jgi:hypothetical protein
LREGVVQTISFPYQIVAGRGRPAPICDVALLGPQGHAGVRALVDSGAVYSVFPRKAAEDAGIMLSAGVKTLIQYGGSRDVGTRLRSYIELGGSRYRVDVVFVERLAFRFALLGRAGVFSQFREVAFLEKAATPRVEFRK